MAHAHFSPSGSSRFLNCPGSINAMKHLPAQPPSDSTMQGTAAHELLAYCLTNSLWDAEVLRGNHVEVDERPLVDDVHTFTVDGDMIYWVNTALNYVRKLRTSAGHQSVEQTVYLKHIDEQLWGTADYVFESMDGYLTVLDLKTGRVDVSVEDNTQLLIYAAGAMATLVKHPERVTHVRLVIIQPRGIGGGGPVKEVVYPIEQLRAFEASLPSRLGVTRRKDAPLKVGDWCQYCPAFGLCQKTRDDLSSAMTILGQTDLELADNSTLEELWKHQKAISKKLDKLKQVMRDRMLQGQDFTLHELHETTRRRFVVDPPSLAKYLLTQEDGDKYVVPANPRLQ